MAIVNHQREPGRIRAFISFAESDREFADYLEYVLSLRGFEAALDRDLSGPSGLIPDCDAGVLILTDASAVSSRCETELERLRSLGKRIAVISPTALDPKTKLLPGIAAAPLIHCWRNPDAPDSSLVNGLIALEDALRGPAPDFHSPSALSRSLTALRRRGLAHLVVVTAFLMCAIGAAPWLLSLASSTRSASAEDRNSRPAPQVTRSVTVSPAKVAVKIPVRIPAKVMASVTAATPQSESPTEIVYIEPAIARATLPAVSIASETITETIAPTPDISSGIAPAPVETAAAPRPQPAAPALSDAERLAKLDDADWLAARKIGTLSAYRGYIDAHAEGIHVEDAMKRARRRIAELSTAPDSTLVYLTQPATFRGLPTFDIEGLKAGEEGQDVYIIDRISTRREGEWLVFERGGAWPFLFVAAPDVDRGK
jgi:hypothetical protein